MALPSTVHVFEIDLSHVDRGVYETLTLKVARHPSETVEYMLTRVLAYALEYEEGIAFSQGLNADEEPALWVHDLTGRLKAWIEVGTPEPARLHRASKATGRVVVYCHKDVRPWFRALAGQRVHAPEQVSIIELDRAFITAVSAKIERRCALALSVSEGQLYLDLGGESFTVALTRHALPA
jgi:uncharacterized protein YaeQ